MTTQRHTRVGIDGAKFTINGEPTYKGRVWKGHPVEGLLLNSRMVNGAFDDEEKILADKWKYADTGRWDPDRNTRELMEAMPLYRRHGLLAITLNLQGGNPGGENGTLTWKNTAFREDGSLKPAYLARVERIIDRADELGMVVILGYFYFGQDGWLRDERAVVAAADNATAWILDNGYTNVIVEVANECENDKFYRHPIIRSPRAHELIDRVQSLARPRYRLLVSTSFCHEIPTNAVIDRADYLLVHGNHIRTWPRVTEMVASIRANRYYRGQPIVFNEDDHFDFDQPENNFVASVQAGASWGYFDWKGYQGVPANWGIDTDRKRAFFGLLAEIAGAEAPPRQ